MKSQSHAIATVALALSLPLLTLSSGCLLIPKPDRHALDALNGGFVLIGAWLGTWPADRTPIIKEFESKINVRLDLVDVYLDWFTPVANVTHTLGHIQKRGSIPILTWEAQTITTQEINAGTKTLPLVDGRRVALNAYIAEFADGVCRVAKSNDYPVYLRILHEMNGNWFAWGLTYERDGGRPNSEESYKAAWIKIHQAFRSRCGDLVRFIYAVNHFSVGDGATYMGPYPGDAYVDFIGIDGYNWGSNAPWGWQNFDVIFKDAYCATTLATSKPLMIAEIASSEKGGNKAQWIRELFIKLEQYPRFRGFVWLHHAKPESELDGRTMDWPVDTSAASLVAFRNGAQAIHGVRTGGPGIVEARGWTVDC